MISEGGVGDKRKSPCRSCFRLLFRWCVFLGVVAIVTIYYTRSGTVTDLMGEDAHVLSLSLVTDAASTIPSSSASPKSVGTRRESASRNKRSGHLESVLSLV